MLKFNNLIIDEWSPHGAAGVVGDILGVVNNVQGVINSVQGVVNRVQGVARGLVPNEINNLRVHLEDNILDIKIIYLIFTFFNLTHFIKSKEIQCICILDFGKDLWNWLYIKFYYFQSMVSIHLDFDPLLLVRLSLLSFSLLPKSWIIRPGEISQIIMFNLNL